MAASTLPGVEELLVRGGLTSAFSVALTTIYTFAFMNFILAFFNLIPIPPLDGSRVLQRFLHGRARQWYAQIERYGFFIVLALLWGGELWGVDLLQGYFAWTVEPLMRFFSGVMS
jgi:Zn-dependent protease